MPTVTIRVNENEKAALETAASASGQTISDYVRETLELRDNQDQLDGLNVRVETLWCKVARLEEIAGL